MRKLTRRGWLTTLCAGVCLVSLGAGAGSASADPFGELARFGSTAQFFQPQALGVDPDEDGAGPDAESVFVLDMHTVTTARDHFRLQKFSAAGTLQATTLIPRPPYACPVDPPPAETSCASSANGKLPFLQGIAVDPARDRLYMLEYIDDRDWVSDDTAVSQIRVFSTEPSGDPATLAELPSIPVPDPSGSQPLNDPMQIEVDPVTHDLLVLAFDRTGLTVVQRFDEAGTPAPDGRFVDTANAMKQGGRTPHGLAIAPSDRTLYVLASALNPSQQPTSQVYWLPPDLTAVTALPGMAAASTREVWNGTSQTTASIAFARGRQLAISVDGGTLYWSEQFTNNTASAPGSYQVRGYSIADAATKVLYGRGTPESCKIEGLGPSLVAGVGDEIYMLDHGFLTPSATIPAYGARVLKFGPDGSGCPMPFVRFTIDGSSDETVTVQKGATVSLDAGASSLAGATATELAWDLDGSGEYATVVTGTPPATTQDHQFITVGEHTVGLRMKLSGGILPTPPSVTRSVVVTSPPPTATFTASTQAPAPGAEVTLDAAGSIDPACTIPGDPPTVAPCNELAEYRWDFGDGQTEVTDEPAVTHAFTNPAQTALSRTVSLTVVSNDDVESLVPFTRTLSVQGTPAPPTCATNPALCPAEQPSCATDPLLCPKQQDPPPPPVPAPGTLSLKAGKVSAAGVAGLTASCRAGGGECVGTATLTARIKAAAKKGKKGKVTKVAVGKATFRIAAGRSQALRVRLSAKAKRQLRKSGKLKVNVAIETRAGGRTSRRSQTLTLTAVKPKKKAKPGKRG